jgi:hypothetical protein
MYDWYMAHPQPRTHQPVLAADAFAVQLVKAEGSAQASAVILVCAKAILAAPRAVNDTEFVLESIFKLALPVFKWTCCEKPQLTPSRGVNESQTPMG